MKTFDQDTYLPTRRTLLERLRDWEDQHSWREFFELYWKLIYRTARKAGLGAEAAEDVVQDAILTVAKNIGELDYNPAKGSFKGWLLKTVKWRIVDHQRKQARADDLLADKVASREEAGENPIDTLVADEHSELDRIWDAEWHDNLVRTVLVEVKKKVTERQFQMYDLYVIQDWSATDVARTLSVGLGQVYLAKHRVGKVMREEAERLGVKPYV